MAFNVGLNVVEVDGVGAPVIVGAAVSVGAFNITTSRGVPNRPTRVNSFRDYEQRFGGLFAGGLGPYLVKGFFDNGGQTAYISRVVATDPATGASPATITLPDAANRGTLRLDAGYRGVADPGAWANDTYVQVGASSSASSRILETAPATVQGTPLAAATDMSSAPALSVIVDGEATPTLVAFQPSDFANATQASRAEIRDAINRRTTKLVASLSPDDRLVLTSTGQVARLRKDWTSLRVNAANAPLGLTTMASPARGTPADRTTTSTRLANVADLQVGDAISVSDGTAPHTANAKLLRIVPTTGLVEWTPAIANIADYDVFQTIVRNVEFDLTVSKGGTEPNQIVEGPWAGLSMESDLPNYAPRVLNDTIRGSRFLIANDERSTSPPGADVPVAGPFARLSPGRDGAPTPASFIGDQTARTGFYAFDAYDVQLLCCERTDPAIVSAALTYCANRGDCMFIGSVPEGYVAAGQAVPYGQAFQGKKVYGALYGPWIKIFDPIGAGDLPMKWIPPTGHVMGVYARIETNRGIWKAPAGDEATVNGALDVEHRLSDAEHTDLVKNGSVNAVRAIPGAGIVVDSSRTLSTDPRWVYVNVRLLFNYVKGSLKQGLRWVRQEPNRDTLWNTVKFSSVTPFLMGLWRQGAFGTGTPEQVFTVICDATNNPPEEVDKGNFRIEVYFYPSKPAETIIIVVGQQPSGATAAEA